MATGGVTENVTIGDLAETPPPTDYDGEESFVVLGRSPTSFTFNEDGSMLLRDAMKSMLQDDEQKTKEQEREEAKWSVPGVEKAKKVDEVKTEKDDNSIGHSFEKCTSGLANLSVEEIQTKIDKMVLENLELKETIQQNNMAMKKQCETILQWQEDVQRVHDSHKAKFEETKRYIEKLQMENLKLKEDLEKSTEREQALQQKMSRGSSVEKTSFDNVQQFQLEAAQKKVELLEVILKERDEAIGRLQRQLQSAEKLKLTQLQQLEDYQKENWELNKRLAIMEKQLNEEKNRFVELKDALEDENKRTTEMYNALLQETRSKSAQPTHEELDNVRQQLMNAQMHITTLELTKTEFQQLVNDKELQIQQLQKQLSDEKAERSDEHAALLAQLDVYRTDYEVETGARNSLLEEKNQMAEDLQNLQRRNQQLIEEVERLRGHSDFVHVGRQRRTSEASSATEVQYACPKCDFKFSDFQTLENHVYRCIELDSLP